MSYLTAHLDQISYSCQGIDSLPFPPPRIFTNALLSNHDITSLIRDTESHERALFSVPAPAPSTQPQPSSSARPDESKQSSSRRRTVFNVTSGEVTTGPPTSRSANPRRHTAVAAVLGGEMHEELRRGENLRGGDVDVDILLKGAEKLCGVYELPGARERIAQLRGRYRAGMGTVAYYEAKVKEQAEMLASYHKDWMDEDDEDEDEGEDGEEVWTEEDLRREEEEAREMEAKKKELQARLRAMQKDLGGLMRM